MTRGAARHGSGAAAWWSGRALVAVVTALGLAACGSGWESPFDERARPGHLADVAIAPPDEALTFARVGDAGARRVLLVTAYRGDRVDAVDVSAALGRPVSDPIALLDELGQDGVRDLLRAAPAAAARTLPAADLVLPVDLGAHHVAAATNFPEHADDAGVEDGPFLFAKLVAPTGPYDPVPAGPGLLDYEVEVAWVTLAPIAAGERPAALGLVACNDVTDRDTLLRLVDPWTPESGEGFATGKSAPGWLPIGNLFVVPRDPRAFVAGLELELWVDGALRQRAPASAMVWDLDAILAHTFAWKDRRWAHRGGEVSLLGGGDVVPARTLLLSGTPHGTIFDGLRARHYLGGLGRWIAGGFGTPLPAEVVAAYVDDARAAGAYLQPGQEVAIRVDRLGVLRNPVVP